MRSSVSGFRGSDEKVPGKEVHVLKDQDGLLLCRRPRLEGLVVQQNF